MTQPSEAPPGWYQTVGSAELRWWDGLQWTGHRYVAPVAVTPAASIAPARPVTPDKPVPTHTAASWLIAVLPLTVPLAGALLVVSDLAPWAIVAMVVLAPWVIVPTTVALALWDASTLRSRGSSMSQANGLWAFLGGWVYLLARALVVKSSDRERWVVLAFSLGVGLLTAIAVAACFYSVAQDQDVRRALLYDEQLTEHEIEQWAYEEMRRTLDADCPEEPPMGAGRSFECVLETRSGQPFGTATVTWDGNWGWYSWIVNEGASPRINEA